MPAGGTVECNICMEMVPAAAVPRPPSTRRSRRRRRCETTKKHRS